MSNFDKIMEETEKTSSQESDFFKFPVGDTKIRILTDFVQTYSLYEGEYPNSKYVKMLPHFEQPKAGQAIKTSAWAWAYIVNSKQLKIVQFPYSLIKALSTLKNDPDWAFRDFPMPYDITVNNTGEGGARYSMRGSPKRTDIPSSVFEDLKTKKTCEEIATRIMDKQGGVTDRPSKESALSPAITKYNYPKEQIDPDEIPF